MSMDRPRVPGDNLAPVLSYPDSGGRVDDLGGREVITTPNSARDLAPMREGTVTRPMLGGLRTAHHAGLLVEAPSFGGGHVELVNRRSVVILEPHEGPELPGIPVIPSMRVPPQSDPLGTRMCANATAAAGAR